MAMLAGNVSGTWSVNPAMTGSGLAKETWDILQPLIAADINTMVDANGAPDAAGQNAAAQKMMNLCNAMAQAIVPHLKDNLHIKGADLEVTTAPAPGAGHVI